MKNWIQKLRRRAPAEDTTRPEPASPAPGAVPGSAPYHPPTAAEVNRRAPMPGLEAALAASMTLDGPAEVAADPGRRQVELRLGALRTLELLPPIEDDHRIANEFRVLKRVVLGNLPSRNATPVPAGNLIMVASALPNEGKTLCTLNLALALSLERDYSVVLVDGDVINPTISRALGIDQEPGLLDVLRTPGATLAEIEIATNYPRLSVIPAGRRDQDAPELLSSQRMAQFAEEMERQPNRLYLFDSTPILLTNESRALSEIVGQILFVVRAGVSQRTAVKSALALLPEDGYVGIVLNQKGQQDLGGDYYYGYYQAPADTTSAA